MTQTTADISATTTVTPQSLNADTEYVVLVSEKVHNEAPLTWKPVGTFTARSSKQAVRQAAAGKTVPMVLVAIPSRSWQPVKVTPKVETTLILEEA